MARSFTDQGMVFGHRGVPWEAPPNTAAGFRRARELGVDGVEFDVQLCKSSQPVVIHDFTVDETTDGSGAVNTFVFEALRELDAGGWFDPAFRGEPIPTLDEVIEECGRDMLLNIELKSETVKSDGLEAVVAGTIRKHGIAGRSLVSSFNPFALFRMRHLLPEVALGLLYGPDMALYLRRTWFAPIVQPQAMHPQHDMLTEEGLAHAKQRGRIINTWTVNDVTVMRRMLDLGINAIITDEPRVLQAVVRGEEPPSPQEVVYKAERGAAA